MLASPTIEHVTVVTEAGWVNPVISLAGVALTALVSWLIYRGNVARADARAENEQTRHDAELDRLRAEAKRAEVRHEQQIQAMLLQGRREREVRFLRELSDYLVAFSGSVRDGRINYEGPELMRLRQFGLKIYADFAEDDDAFAWNVAEFLEDLASRTETNKPQSNPFGEEINWGEFAEIANDAERGAFYLLRWLHPDLRLGISQAFERYRMHGYFEAGDDSDQ